MNEALRVPMYRYRATFGRRVGGYLGVVLLIGLIGGIAMGSIAAARRTQSSYPSFLASTNPSDLTASGGAADSGESTTSASLTNKIAHLPDVERVESLVSPNVFPLAADGTPRLAVLANTTIFGSLDGMLVNQDRVTVVQGRMEDPERSDEIVMTASASQQLSVRVGQLVPLGVYTGTQTDERAFGTAGVVPRLRVRARLVGIVVLNNEVVQDDVDRAYGFIVLTPALVRQAVAVSPSPPQVYGLRLDHGDRDVPQVERAFAGLLPPGSTYQFHQTARVVADVELSVKPESVALGAFGVIAGLVALALGTQAISRQLSLEDEDRLVLRALGASPALTAGDGLIGILAAVLVGSSLAFAVAVALSPLGPLGPVRPVYPHPGIAFDWAVLGVGCAVLVIGLGAGAIGLCYTGARRLTGREHRSPARGSSVARAAEATGMSVVALIGVRFALEPGRGRPAVPARSALVGTVLAVAMVVATLTFASGLHTLVSHPSLYGWNWDYMLNPSNDVPPRALNLLDDDSAVAAWSGASLANAEIDGQSIPILLESPGAEVSPPVLSGHGLDANDQIVLGAATMAQFHAHVGDTVVVSYGAPADAPIYIPPTRVRIVGTATFPAVGYTSFIADHTSMGTGALISTGVEPAAFKRATTNPDPNLNGPEMVFVRLRHGVGAAAGRANLERVAEAANRVFAADHNPDAASSTVSVLGVLRPVQIVNYRSIGSTPVILAAGLALGSVVALGLTLASSVRRRRRDIALLKALGFTQRQLAAVVAWQSTVAAVIGIVVGLPLGIVIGRQLWVLFARNINAVPDPTVPVLSVLLVGIGALVFANLVAALPGRRAARTPTALVLRAE